MKGFLLAAGFGKRMGGLTTSLPKPLLPVNGIPLIYYSLFWLSVWEIEEVIINTHYLAQTIEDELREFPWFPLRFSYEPEILGTAGGIGNVRKEHLKGSRPFVVMNPDTIVIPDIEKDRPPQELPRDVHSLLYLLPREDPAFAGFHFTTDDDRIHIDNTHGRYYYMGYSVLRPTLIDPLPPGQKAELVTFWEEAGEKGELMGRRFYGKVVDAGTRAAYESIRDVDPIPELWQTRWEEFLDRCGKKKTA